MELRRWRTPLAVTVLSILAEEPRHAYRIRQVIKQRGREDTMAQYGIFIYSPAPADPMDITPDDAGHGGDGQEVRKDPADGEVCELGSSDRDVPLARLTSVIMPSANTVKPFVPVRPPSLAQVSRQPAGPPTPTPSQMITPRGHLR